MISGLNILQCDYCSSTFATEKGYKKHNCKFKKRYTSVTESTKGVMAYQYYLKWLRSSGKSTKYVDEHTFIHSTQYNHFRKFMDMCKERGVPDRDIFIKIMAKKNISPQHWNRDDVFAFFLEEYDTKVDPIKHIDKSVDTILKLSDAIECDPEDIFDHLDNETMLVLIKSRKISPWLLLNSKKFKQYMIKKASAREREYIQKYINPKKWKKILNSNSKLTNAAKLIVEEFGL